MIRSSATICLVETIPEGRGPWLFWHDLERSCAEAAALGFDGVELFAGSPDSVDAARLERCLATHRLALAAVGTGAGKVLHGLSLTHDDATVRSRARNFVAETIDFGARFGAPTIVGSMQGSTTDRVGREQALAWLADGLEELGERAAAQDTCVLIEPLNRYEGDLLRRLDDASRFVDALDTEGVRLLADLFHMNIEEVSIGVALRAAGHRVGHVHFADSNRKAAGLGHTDFVAVGDALRAIAFDGFASAEVFPDPSPREAAEHTIAAFVRFLANP